MIRRAGKRELAGKLSASVQPFLSDKSTTRVCGMRSRMMCRVKFTHCRQRSSTMPSDVAMTCSLCQRTRSGLNTSSTLMFHPAANAVSRMSALSRPLAARRLQRKGAQKQARSNYGRLHLAERCGGRQANGHSARAPMPWCLIEVSGNRMPANGTAVAIQVPPAQLIPVALD